MSQVEENWMVTGPRSIDNEMVCTTFSDFTAPDTDRWRRKSDLLGADIKSIISEEDSSCLRNHCLIYTNACEVHNLTRGFADADDPMLDIILAGLRKGAFALMVTEGALPYDCRSTYDKRAKCLNEMLRYWLQHRGHEGVRDIIWDLAEASWKLACGEVRVFQGGKFWRRELWFA